MRMKCLRILPETMPRISRSEPSSLSLNMALGNAVVTVASTSIGSDLATNSSKQVTVTYGATGILIGRCAGHKRCAADVSGRTRDPLNGCLEFLKVHRFDQVSGKTRLPA